MLFVFYFRQNLQGLSIYIYYMFIINISIIKHGQNSLRLLMNILIATRKLYRSMQTWVVLSENMLRVSHLAKCNALRDGKYEKKTRNYYLKKRIHFARDNECSHKHNISDDQCRHIISKHENSQLQGSHFSDDQWQRGFFSSREAIANHKRVIF